MNNQRRMFRGRAGPTDGRLPKHNARRRRRQHTTEENSSPNNNDEAIIPDNLLPVADDEALEELREVNVVATATAEGLDDTAPVQSAEESPRLPPGADRTTTKVVSTPPDSISEEERAFLREVGHLGQRIRNNKSALQTASTLANPSTYQTNVLKAVQNCVIEWRSIVRHYPDQTQLPSPQGEPPNKISVLCKQTGLSLYELVQRALQSGPLAGAKPGYFARCGSDVAQVVLDFLEVISSPSVLEMHWSEKQASAVETWKRNASKAVAKQKDPSKSVQTKMSKAESRSTAKKELKQKKAAKKQAASIVE